MTGNANRRILLIYIYHRCSQIDTHDKISDTGAIYAVMSFFACVSPNTKFLIFFVLPVPAWAVVTGFLVWDGYSAITDRVGPFLQWTPLRSAYHFIPFSLAHDNRRCRPCRRHISWSSLLLFQGKVSVLETELMNLGEWML